MFFFRKFLCFYFLPIGFFFCLPKLQGNPEDPPKSIWDLWLPKLQGKPENLSSYFWDSERRAWVASAKGELSEKPKRKSKQRQSQNKIPKAKASNDVSLSAETDCFANKVHRFLTDKSNMYCFAVDQIKYKPTSFILSGIGLFVASVNIKQKSPFIAKTCLALSVGNIAWSLAKSLWDLGSLSFKTEKAKE